MKLYKANVVFKNNYYVGEEEDLSGYKEYSFVTMVDYLEYGDIVIVETRHGLRLATFVGYEAGEIRTRAMLVGRVDTEGMSEVKEYLETMLELRSRMERRKQELAELEVYELLAEKDEEMRTLLDTYKSLGREME